ncbi:putative fatty-acid--CoA ligase FadD10 [Mortierella polycephala]|uniref:Fatty-acid--CoA ligase FadD10 n=1 Tax=Mortierella polycephala TaxID=41804 RepID=A0A9P6TWZ0_9FUNG|nr:putative fatty-acid--CoA ligase FadD10 [Mortierella polycephala]
MTIYRSHVPDHPIPQINAYTFAISNPDTKDSAPILTDALTKRVITYGDWKRDTRLWATGLQSMGFKRGDVAALFSFNQVDYSITMFGPIILGGVATTVNSAYSADELAFQLEDSGASVIVVHPELLPVAIEGAKKVGIPMNRILLYGDAEVDGFRPYSATFPPADTPESQLAQVVNLNGQPALETTALICYSSGTTGKSKGVELTHVNFISNTVQVTPMEGDIPMNENIQLAVLPMYHIYGIQLHLMYGIYNGIQTIVLQKFNPVDFLKAIQDHKITSLNLVPPQILMLVKAPIVDKYDLSSVRFVMSGAAPCSAELSEALVKKFPRVLFRQGYGMSEMSPASHVGLYHDVVHGSIGRVLCNQEVRLVDPETGKDVARGERGELWVRGPNVMKGYRNNVNATKETVDSDGWLHTGDIAIVDERETFFIVDRLKELIKYKGFQVAPAELEALLLDHPLIMDAAVIGVENKEQATEVPLAFVVKAPGAGDALTGKEIENYVASKVAAHKKLRGGVRFIDVVPKSAAGKILRKDLRALVQQAPKAKL